MRLPTTQLYKPAHNIISYFIRSNECTYIYMYLCRYVCTFTHIYMHVNLQIIELHFCARNIITGRSAFLCNACVCTTENGAMGRQTYRKYLPYTRPYVLIYCRDSRPPPLCGRGRHRR